MFELRDYQKKLAEDAFEILKANGLVYITSEERTGKSLSAIEITEMSTRSEVLIITKKQAIAGWEESLANYKHLNDYTIINYESIHKITVKPDIVILDESHVSLAAYPKPSKTFLKVAKVVYGLPLIYLSATPFAESYSQCYHQLRLSPWSPFAEYKSFYKWFDEFGIPELQYLGARQIKLYKKTQEDRIKKFLDPITIGLTRAEVGFEHEPTNKVHTIILDADTEKSYLDFSKNLVMELEGEEILAESMGALLQKLSQMVGGTMKMEIGMKSPTQKDYRSVFLGNTEKIDYIKEHFGDNEDTVIMYYYQKEEELLNHHFKKAQILQADRYAEGISLKHIDNLIIYSMSWRTSKYIQRRARQTDLTRDTPIVVHFILTEDKVDKKIYEAVVEKGENFTARMFKSEN